MNTQAGARGPHMDARPLNTHELGAIRPLLRASVAESLEHAARRTLSARYRVLRRRHLAAQALLDRSRPAAERLAFAAAVAMAGRGGRAGRS